MQAPWSALEKETVSKCICSDAKFSTANRNTGHQGLKSYGNLNMLQSCIGKQSWRCFQEQVLSQRVLMSTDSLEPEKIKADPLAKATKKIWVPDKPVKMSGCWWDAFREHRNAHHSALSSLSLTTYQRLQRMKFHGHSGDYGHRN